jgi:pyrrolidone-carboxylate peptidase
MGDCGPAVPSIHTQLAGHPSLSSADSDDINVLVTGFGPFKTNLVNASFLIASSLPPSLTFTVPQSSSAAPEGPTTAHRVFIHVHPNPIPVAYSTVQSTVPSIVDDYAKTHGGQRPDIVIHMGIAATRQYYSVETKAHRDSYLMSDIEGRSGYEAGEKRWRALDLPPVLQAGRSTDPLSISDIAEGTHDQVVTPSSQAVQSSWNPHPPNHKLLNIWKSFAPGADVRLSEDAGRYLCEFIFYTSLAHAFKQGQDRNVVFLHVPGSYNDQAIQTGREVTIALIKALITCWADRTM